MEVFFKFSILIVIFTIILIIPSIRRVFINCITNIINFLKSPKEEKEKITMLLIIFAFPIVIIILDYYNWFGKIFPNYSNLTREYDMLSFIATYSGTIVSAILLIFITEKDRNENTEVLRSAERPYLDISYMKVESDFLEKEKDNIMIFNHGAQSDTLDKEEYLTIYIKNTGASVAIIDTNKTKIKLCYKINGRIIEEDVYLNFAINRLSIRSGDEIYIKFIKNNLYKNKKLLEDSKIIYSGIYYKDLFNVEYYDECELKDNLKVLHDNEKIDNS